MKILPFIFLWVALPALGEEPAASTPDAATPIDLTIVGYDVDNNTNAQRQFQAMAEAVTKSGGKGQVLTAGLKDGELESAMTTALGTVAAPPPPPEPSLRLEQPVVTAGQKIRVFIENPPSEKGAWIGFYKLDAANRTYIKYSYLNVLDNHVYEDVLAPDEAGLYNFRLFKDESYQPIRVSAPIEVR